MNQLVPVHLPTMKQLIAVMVLLAGACCSAQNSSNQPREFSFVREVFDKCSGDLDFVSCSKLNAVRLLDRAFKVNSLPVLDFVHVERNVDVQEEPGLPTADALEASLPRDLQQKNSALDRILMEKLWSYLNTRTIKMDLPSDIFESRGKGGGLKLKKIGKKNGGMILMMFGAVGAMLLKLALATVALLAGKALLVSKVALLLVAVFGVKSLLSKAPEEKHSQQVVYAEPEMHGGWSRSSAIPEAAHDLAYWGQRSFRSRQVGTTSSLPA